MQNSPIDLCLAGKKDSKKATLRSLFLPLLYKQENLRWRSFDFSIYRGSASNLVDKADINVLFTVPRIVNMLSIDRVETRHQHALVSP